MTDMTDACQDAIPWQVKWNWCNHRPYKSECKSYCDQPSHPSLTPRACVHMSPKQNAGIDPRSFTIPWAVPPHLFLPSLHLWSGDHGVSNPAYFLLPSFLPREQVVLPTTRTVTPQAPPHQWPDPNADTSSH